MKHSAIIILLFCSGASFAQQQTILLQNRSFLMPDDPKHLTLGTNYLTQTGSGADHSQNFFIQGRLPLLKTNYFSFSGVHNRDLLLMKSIESQQYSFYGEIGLERNKFSVAMHSKARLNLLLFETQRLNTTSQWAENGFNPGLANGEPLENNRFSSNEWLSGLTIRFSQGNATVFGKASFSLNHAAEFMLGSDLKLNKIPHSSLALAYKRQGGLKSIEFILRSSIPVLSHTLEWHLFLNKFLQETGLAYPYKNLSIGVLYRKLPYKSSPHLPGISLQYKIPLESSPKKNLTENSEQLNNLPANPNLHLPEPVSISNSTKTVVPIQFEFNKWKLKKGDQKLLDQLILDLLENPEKRVIIIGHSDRTGDQKAKQKVSENRAKAVAEYFSEKGINENRISIMGVSDQYPLVEELDYINRRIELIIF